jgi:coenzyme F420-0:L-glutamate ligase/coenzyme F420-1:gamma-L-glutamate ligase
MTPRDQIADASQARFAGANNAGRVALVALPDIPLVGPGDDLAAIIVAAAACAGETLIDGDILVVAQKIVSKSEDCYADLTAVTPSARAAELARETGKDPRMVELILSESSAVVRHRPGVIIAQHRLGFVMANAGIDTSNVGPPENGERVLLLPKDPDGSAAKMRRALRDLTGAALAVIINDSVGRAWRMGTVGTALGAAGLTVRLDYRGRTDLFGRTLKVTDVGLADQIASAASLLQGEADEGRPVVLIRGLRLDGGSTTGSDMIRDEADDLFR